MKENPWVRLEYVTGLINHAKSGSRLLAIRS
jgi:hypothetical protein